MSIPTTNRTATAPRRRLAAVLLAGATGFSAIAAITAAPLGATTVAAGNTGTPLDVVVRAETGHSAAALRTFVALGGEVGTALPIIEGFSGTITDDLVDAAH